MGDRLPDLLRSVDPARAALVTAETGHTLGYGALADTVGSLAGRLAALGIERGSRVAIVLPDGPELLRVLFAVVALGATAAPLNPAYKRDEYAFYLDDLRPELLLVSAASGETVREAAGRRVRAVEVTSSRGELTLLAGGRAVEHEAPFE